MTHDVYHPHPAVHPTAHPHANSQDFQVEHVVPLAQIHDHYEAAPAHHTDYDYKFDYDSYNQKEADLQRQIAEEKAKIKELSQQKKSFHKEHEKQH